MHAVNEISLRERKALETQHSIERATIELALAHGLASVTTEQIAERANISTRTFFNYFASKEDAVMGYAIRDKDTDILAQYLSEPSAAGTYADLREFVITLFGGHMAQDFMFNERMEVLADNPHVMRTLLGYLEERIRALTQLVAGSLAAEAGTKPAPEHEEAAAMLVHIAGTAVGYAMERWRNNAAVPSPEHDLTQAFALLERVAETHVHAPQGK